MCVAFVLVATHWCLLTQTPTVTKATQASATTCLTCLSHSRCFGHCDGSVAVQTGQKYKQGDIIKAAWHADVKQLEQCINLGARVDELDDQGNTR